MPVVVVVVGLVEELLRAVGAVEAQKTHGRTQYHSVAAATEAVLQEEMPCTAVARPATSRVVGTLHMLEVVPYSVRVAAATAAPPSLVTQAVPEAQAEEQAPILEAGEAAAVRLAARGAQERAAPARAKAVMVEEVVAVPTRRTPRVLTEARAAFPAGEEVVEAQAKAAEEVATAAVAAAAKSS